MRLIFLFFSLFCWTLFFLLSTALLWFFLVLLLFGWKNRWLFGLFNFNLNFILFINSDFLIDSQLPIREEKLNGNVIINAKEVTGRKWKSKNLKRFVLIASLLIICRSNYSYKFYKFLELIILHAGLIKSYNSVTFEFPDLYSLMNVSSSRRRPILVEGCSKRSLMPLLVWERNWLKRDAKLSIWK